MENITVNQMKSDSNAKLFEALSKAQMEITGAAKTKKNPHFKSDYADLNSTWEAFCGESYFPFCIRSLSCSNS